MKPKVYDLYCGLFGWGTSFAQEGYEVIGFDIEDMSAVLGIHRPEGCELRIRDVRSIHGSELKDATCIVGSSPCQEFSYRAMPWKKAKALPPPYLGIELFNAQFRIQREAIEAAGHYIQMVVENVRGAQKWVGKAQYHFGSFYLWGDVPALMPMTLKRDVTKMPGRNMSGDPDKRWGAHVAGGYEKAMEDIGRKVSGDWFGNYADMKASGTISPGRLHGKNSVKRKAASAMIAKIPFPLSSHIARTFKPVEDHDEATEADQQGI